MAAHFFFDSVSLMDYVHANDVYVRHDDVRLGTISFIDFRDLHVAFDCRDDYERWRADGCPVQLSLF